MRAPTGTVTFLFTDIVGSTAAWEAHPGAMAVALARHDALVRQAITAEQGVVFATGGDGLAAAFGRAVEAVRAAVLAQSMLADEAWPEAVPIRVRMGIHTGEAEERDGDYFGPVVNRTARLMALADGGHIVASRTTADIVRGQLPDGWALVDVGEHELRSLRVPERLFEVTWPGSAPPTLVASDRAGRRLPDPGPLVGRDDERESVRHLLLEHRLVTLTGVGGAGKTSLALLAARDAAASFDDGVWFCELDAAFRPEDVAQVVFETLGLRPEGGISAANAVVGALAGQRCLVLLDNCEHVLDAATALTRDVLRRCPMVTVLATSREGLGLREERLVNVRPLGTADAVRLFRDRIADHSDAAVGSAADDAVLAAICERLDGLPLAIELAAARARSIPLPELAERLGQRFRLLRGARHGSDRQQTLRATVAWSYELLRPEEQDLFDQLSVFADGFTLDAAEHVCAVGDHDALELDDLLGALVDKSMVLLHADGRYHLLETLRQFGEEQLATKGDPARLRTAHAAHYVAVVRHCHDGLQSDEQERWLRRLHADWANIRSAFGWARESGDVATAAAIATHLVWPTFWHDVAEPYAWVTEVAQMDGADHDSSWADVLAARAWVAWEHGRNEEAVALGLAALEAAPGGRPTIDYMAEFAIVSGAFILGDYERMRAFLDGLMARVETDPRPIYRSWHHTSSGMVAFFEGRHEDAIESTQLARRLAHAIGNPNMVAWAASIEGSARRQLHDPEALPILLEGLDLARRTGSRMAASMLNRAVAAEMLDQGRARDAVPHILEELWNARRRDAWVRAPFMAAVTALTALGDADTAAALFGWLSEHRLGAIFEQFAAEARPLLERTLSADRLARQMAVGAEMSVQQIAQLAEAALEEPLPARP